MTVRLYDSDLMTGELRKCEWLQLSNRRYHDICNESGLIARSVWLVLVFG
jgi:hypothetical protein